MNFFQRLQLAWGILWYRGPWMSRYVPDEPSVFDYPPDVMSMFPAPGSDKEIVLAKMDTPMLRLLPRQGTSDGVYNFSPLGIRREQVE